MPSPLITVVIPLFNQGHFLAEAVASVQSQSVENWEIVVVNDGSTDGSESMANELADADSRIRVVTKPNGGLASARNTGLRHARGTFIQFLDSDDTILPHKFSRHIDAGALQRLSEVTYLDYRFGRHDDVSEWVDGRRVSVECRHHDRPILDFASRWEFDLSIPIHAPLFPAWPFTQGHVRFLEALPNHEDWCMWIDLLRFVPRLHFVDFVGAVYRLHPAGMTRNQRLMAHGYKMAVRHQLRHGDHDQSVRVCLERLYAAISYSLGKSPWERARRRSIQVLLRNLPLRHHRYVWRVFGMNGDPDAAIESNPELRS